MDVVSLLLRSDFDNNNLALQCSPVADISSVGVSGREAYPIVGLVASKRGSRQFRVMLAILQEL